MVSDRVICHPTFMPSRKRNAFTLAETLIVLAILGVVAALTMPTLNANLSQKSLAAQLQKFCSVFSDAIDLYMVDQETDTVDQLNFDQKEFANKFKIVAAANGDNRTNGTEFFASSYINNSRNSGPLKYLNDHPAYRLKDGTVFSFWYESGVIKVLVDLNGAKKPNTYGKDVWFLGGFGHAAVDDIQFAQYGEESLSDPGLFDHYYSMAKSQCATGEGLYGCFAQFMRTGFASSPYYGKL